MNLKLISSKISTIYILIYAQGNKNRFTISKLDLKILDGHCKSHGTIDWGEVINWSNICIFNNIIFFQKYLKVPIELSGRVISQGYLGSNSWELNISDLYIHGNINNKKIFCNAKIYIKSNGNVSIPVFLIDWGSNILEITGRMQKNHAFNINIKLNMVDLSIFSSKFNGNVYGSFRLYGSITSPKLSLNIDASSLNWESQEISIDTIVVRSNIDYRNFIQSNFDLKANQIQYKCFLLYQLFIKGTGNLKKHNFSIGIQGDQLFGLLNLIGQFDPKYQIWNGQISKTNIVTPMGTWRLMKDIVLIYQHLSRQIILKSHYWENTYCYFPVFNVVQKNILKKLDIIFRNFNFVVSEENPVKKIVIQNACISCTDFYWIVGSKYLSKGSVIILGSVLDMKCFEKQRALPIIMNNVQVQIILTQSNIIVNWVFNINNNRNFGEFIITNLYDKIPKISGKIKIKNISLIPILKSLSQSSESMQGLFNININFEGNLYYPKIYGVVKLNHLNINFFNIPLYIKNGMLEINFCGDYAILHGIIDTEYGGQLYLDGNISSINSKNINILLKVRGDEINIYVSPKTYARVSPNLICIITSEKIDIQGNIDINSARITIKEFSKNVTEISSEEILLDSELNPILNQYKDLSFCVSSRVIVNLGHDVNFNGLGLHTKLRGNLEIKYNKNDLSVVGYINIFSGSFEAYGQNLIIKKGQLLFSGPINQVYLDIEVIRNPYVFSHIQDSVTAGIRMTGILNQLKLDFFSDSSLLSQQEILSYLLGGYNLVFSNTSDANMVTSLLIGVSMKRYEKFIDKIGKVLGVQDLKINTQDFGIPSLVALSGYIAPGLQVKYGISIFDLLTTVTIRYCIHSQFYCEATSGGRNQELDLLYQFDFN